MSPDLAKALSNGCSLPAAETRPLRSPTDPSSLLIKRLVALPKTLVRTLPPHPESTVRVPPGHCWIEGDERFHTRDSNTFGPVPLGLIESKVEYIVWPPRSVYSLSLSLVRATKP